MLLSASRRSDIWSNIIHKVLHIALFGYGAEEIWFDIMKTASSEALRWTISTLSHFPNVVD